MFNFSPPLKFESGQTRRMDPLNFSIFIENTNRLTTNVHCWSANTLRMTSTKFLSFLFLIVKNKIEIFFRSGFHANQPSIFLLIKIYLSWSIWLCKENNCTPLCFDNQVRVFCFLLLSTRQHYDFLVKSKENQDHFSAILTIW